MNLLKRLFSYLMNPRAQRPSPTTNSARLEGPALDAMETPSFRSRVSVFNLPLIVGSLIVIALILVVLFGPIWADHDPYITAQAIVPYFDTETNKMVSPPFPPSLEYPLGTDEWGNDLWSLILHGARTTLVAGVYIAIARVLVGAAMGSLAGWFADRGMDRIIMGAVAVIASVPMLLSSMILVFALDIQNGLWVFLVALTAVGWTEVAQYIRSEMLVIREMPYVEGARAVGLRELQIIVRHALPNVLPQLLIMTFLELGAVLILMAELGFLGVYIGGGTSYTFGELFADDTVILSEVPEWGALVAQGAPTIRSTPFLVIAPALAFFVSVVGLNAFGEGLRRLMDRSAISTNFILQRKMLLVLAAFVAVTAVVIEYTGPRLSFVRTTRAFDAANVVAEASTLAAQQDGQETAAYLAQTFNDLELWRGWNTGVNSSFVYTTTTTIVQPAAPPELALVTADGQRQPLGEHGVDFGYVVAGHGGSGAVTAPVTFVAFPAAEAVMTDGELEAAIFRGLDVRGHIVMLDADSAPPAFATEALRRGALGLLWVTADDTEVRSQVTVNEPDGKYLQRPTLPIFRLRRSAADNMLAATDLSMAQLLAEADRAGQEGPGWFARDLELAVSMSVQLRPAKTVDVPHVLGLIPGYDDELAHEMIVVYTTYDAIDADLDRGETAVDNDVGLATMIELARLWQAQNIDPRRTVLFIAWGGRSLDEEELTTFLENPENFKKLTARVPSAPLSPALLVEIDATRNDGDPFAIVATSDTELEALFMETAAQLDVSLADAVNGTETPISQEISTIALSWPAEPEQPDPQFIQQVGETVSLSAIKLMREIRWWQ